MKFFVIVALLILGVFTIRADLTTEEAIAMATGCKEEVGASDDDFKAMTKHHAPNSREGKCLLACTLKKFGVMSDDGKMLKDEAIKLSTHVIKDEDEKDLAVAIIEACEALEVSEDHCEAAEEYALCVHNEFESKDITSMEDLI